MSAVSEQGGKLVSSEEYTEPSGGFLSHNSMKHLWLRPLNDWKQQR